MKNVVYTSIIGGYDILRQPGATEAGWDYICFCDGPVTCEDGHVAAPGEKYGVWQLRMVPPGIKNRINRSRYARMHPHLVLKEYEWSVYHDGNVQIADAGFYTVVQKHIDADNKICHVPHLWRDCIYDEIVECYRNGHIGFLKAISIRNRLRKDGFPAHVGLYETNLILRKHNEPEVVSADEMWWRYFSSGQKRDQLSLNYVYWKLGLKPALLFREGENARNNSHIHYHPHPAPQIRQTWLRRKVSGTLIRLDAAIRRYLIRFI
ncbi:MAG: DUF616 domain-containing protein [Bacteroidales bacterium]|nr:DUF616 domain-containing protein [Bacteroidales bacterium]